MRKLFTLLAAASILMILVSGLGVYWMSNNEVIAAKNDSAAAEAKSVALGLSAQINLLNKTFDKMAQDPEVLSALLIGNVEALDAVALRLEKHIPDILKLRLLLPNTNQIDEQYKPRMGFADLDLVRETLKSNQFPSIQGDKGFDRHLAIARSVAHNGKVIGVILASLDESVIVKSLRLSTVKNGYFELKQGAMVLGVLGQQNGLQDMDSKQITVPNTDWAIHYQSAAAVDFGNFSLKLSFIVIPSLILLMVFFTGNQWLSNVLSQDLESLMKAFKNLMTNSPQSNYPVELAEMNAAISNLMQFKRVLDYGDKEILETDEITNIIVSDDEDFELDGLFDEANNFKL
jgi:phosphomannomutase/phosphoglucomutase